MKTGFRKWLSLLSAVVLTATTIATSVFVSYAAVEKPASYAYTINTSDPAPTVTVADAEEGSGIRGDNGVWSIYKGEQVVNGGIVYHAAQPYPITDYLFYTIECDYSWIGSLTFQASTDGENWIDIEPEDEQGNDHNPGWVTHFRTHYGQFAPEDNIHYLRANIGTATTFPGVQYVQYNVGTPSSYAFQINTSDPAPAVTVADAEEGSGIRGDNGVWSIYKGEQVVNGGIVYHAAQPYPITDYLFYTIECDYSWIGSLTFQASTDGENWIDIEPEDEQGNDHNPGWVTHFRTHYGQFAPEDNIHYLRANIGSATTFPGVQYVQYNVGTPSSYAFQINTSDPAPAVTVADAAEGAAVDGANGVWSIYKEGSVVDGSLIYYAQNLGPITDYLFYTIECDYSWLGSITYQASADGVEWIDIAPDVKQGDVHNSGWVTHYLTHYGRFAPEENIHYLRANIGGAGLYPGVQYVQYNTYDKSVDCTYQIPGSAYMDYTSNGDGQPVEGPSDIHFDGTSGWGLRPAGGTLTYTVPLTTQLKVTATGSSSLVTIEVSADNQNWTSLAVEEREGDTDHSAFKGYTHYGEADMPFRYVRVTLAEGTYTPSVCNLYVVPLVKPEDAYLHSLSVSDPSVKVETEGVFLTGGADLGDRGAFFAAGTTEPSTANGIDGSLTFTVEGPITSFTLRGSENVEGVLKFEYSTDGANFQYFAPYRVDDEKTGHWQWMHSYYDSFDEALGVRYIRVSIVKNGNTFGLQPSIGTFQFNAVLPDKFADCTYQIPGSAYMDYTSNGDGQPGEGPGDIHFDGTSGWGLRPAGGTLTYTVPLTTQLKVTATGSSSLVTIEVSADNQNWTSLAVEEREGDTDHSAFKGYTHCGEADTPFRYVRVTLAEGTYAPSVCNLYVNPLIRPEESYEHSMAPNDPSVKAETEGVFLTGGADLGDRGAFFAAGTTEPSTANGIDGSLTFTVEGPITSFTLRGSENVEGVLKFEYSTDGANFQYFAPYRVSDERNPNHWQWMHSYYDSFDEALGVRYIRVSIVKNGNTFGLQPSIGTFQFNAVLPDKFEDCTYQIPGGKYIGYTSNSDGQPVEGPSDIHFDGTSGWGMRTAGGSLTYTVPLTTQLMVTATGSSSLVTIEVSADNQNWTSLAVEEREGDTSHSAFKGYTHCGEADTPFRYVRVTLAEGTYTPSVCNLYVNPLVQPETDYEYSVAPNDSSVKAETEGVFLTGGADLGDRGAFFAAGTTEPSTGNGIDGSLIFKAKGPITSFVLRGSENTEGFLTFEYSTDGENFQYFAPYRVSDERNPNHWQWMHQYYDTFDAELGVAYIRVSIVKNGNTFGLQPSIGTFRYNADGEFPIERPDYTEHITPDQNAGVESEGTLVTGVFEIESFYLFHNESGNAVPGKILFYSELPITDYNFHVLEAQNGWGGNITYSASVDGKTWVAIEDYTELVTGIKSKDWGPGLFKDIFGFFTAADDIHYLRVELNNNGGFAKQPALEYVEYNVDGVIRPTLYKFQETAQEDAETDSEGVLTPTAADSAYANFRKDGAPVEGQLIFASTDYISDLSIRLLTGKDGKGGTVTFSYSPDGVTWTAFTPYTEKTGDAGDGEYVDYYTKFPAGHIARYIRVELHPDGTASDTPAVAGIRFNTGERYYEYLEPTAAIEDLDLPEMVSDFASGSYGDSIFRLSGMSVTNNGTNNEYIGGNFGMVQELQDAYAMFYTPGMKDFKFTATYPGGYSDDADTNIVQYKAYGRKTQNGEEVEIPLIRIKLGESGFHQYLYRPADRDSMDDYLYLRIEAKIEVPLMVQLLNFTFFYDGDEPGPVPEEEGAGGAGTDRTNVKTYNFIKGNMNPLRAENMVQTTNSIGNVAYIGTQKALITETAGFPSWVTFRADGMTYFYVKVVMDPKYVGSLPVKILVAPNDNDDEYVEIPLKYELTKDQPTGWVSVEYMPADGAEIPAGTRYIKYLLEEGDQSSQLVRIDYEYEEPEATALPAWKTPDTANGQKELLDLFESTGLLTEQGGKMEDYFQVSVRDVTLVPGSAPVRVILKDEMFSDGILVYRVDDNVDAIDVRGYRRTGSDLLPVIRVSADGENWTVLEDGELTLSLIFDGPEAFSLSNVKIPQGMKYVRVEFPDLEEGITDLMLSGVQILYGSTAASTPGDGNGGDNGDNGDNGETPNVPTGVALPAAAGVLACLSGAALLASRKRREEK